MSSPPSPRLAGIRAKIKRAEEHIDDLKSRIDSFIKTRPYSVSTESDLKTSEKVYRVHFRSQIPLRFPILVGDVLHNLRSTLDHLVWQLVEADGNVPTRDICYPIFKSASASDDFFEKLKTSSDPKVKGIPRAAVQLIKKSRPYKGGNDDLWAIHELNNIDKHRLLITVAAANRQLAIARGGKRQSVWVRPEPILLQDGAEIFRRPLSLEGKEDKQFQFTFEIAFGEPEVIKGKLVVPLLHKLAHLVEGIVSQFVPFL